jgi:tRNA threonylcarbamoyladenosine biosynthesis protein TsaB
MELAIDTSTEFAGISLSEKGFPIIELSWHAGQNHTVELLPNIDKVLKQKQVAVQSLTAIFVALGPGSFNGLRVGLSAAKGFVLALDIPIVGISTLEVEAYPFASTGLPICPIHNAGRGEIATAKYSQKVNWQCLESEHLTTVEALIDSIKVKTIFCGEIPGPAMENINNSLGKLAIIPDETARLRRPGFLARLAWQRLIDGQKDDPITLQPIYLRQPPITLMKEKTIKK